MHKIRRNSILFLFFLSAGLLATGFYLQTTSPDHILLSHKLIGSSVALGFFVVMPMFIYHRWKGKNVKDYMLTEDNIKKMKEFNDSKKK